MQCLEARLASYAAVTRPKKHAKVAFPLSAESHPFLTPAALAAAGFYHYPGKESDPESHDTCRCFLCGLVLGGWDDDDDPFAEHVKREGDCAWKELVCRIEVDRAGGGPGRLRTTYPDSDSLPSSLQSSAYRENTFSDWWPHKKPSAKVLAQAGFISTPSKAAPDGTTCPLCNYEVEQWEEDDDPLAVHQHKEPACPFFTATVEKKSRRKTATTAKRGRTTTTVSRAAAAAEPAPEAEPEHEPEREAEPEPEPVVEPEAEPEPVPGPKRRGRPPKASTAASSLAASTTSTAARKTTRTRKTKAKEAEEVEEVVEPVAAAPEPEPVEEPAPVEEEAPKKGRKTKPLPKKRTTRKTAATIEAEEAPEATMEPDVAVEAPPKPPPKSKARATKTTKATKAAAAAVGAEAEPSAPAPVAASEPTRIPVPTSPRTKSVPTRPLSQLDRFANLPAPAPMPDVGPTSTTKAALASPSVRHAVAAMVRDASPAPAAASVARPVSPDKELPPLPELPPLFDEQRKMTLEEYVRQQYAARADEMRASGETMIAAWEARTREARARIEQA